MHDGRVVAPSPGRIVAAVRLTHGGRSLSAVSAPFFLIRVLVSVDRCKDVFRIFQSAAFQFILKFALFVQSYGEAGVLPCIGGFQEGQQSP